VLEVLKITRCAYTFGQGTYIETQKMYTPVATTHGAIPYIMAIAMIKVSPIVIVKLNEGNRCANGIVMRASSASHI
jgi:hypothetical protein